MDPGSGAGVTEKGGLRQPRARTIFRLASAPPRPAAMDSDDKPTRGRLLGAEHRYPLRVYFEDTDLSGIVYHARYLHFCERARSEMLALAGVDQRALFEAQGIAYAVTHIDIAYRAPARLDDLLLIKSRILAVRGASTIIRQRIERDDQGLAEARVTAALIGPDGRPRRQPDSWRGAFEAIRTADKPQDS